MHRCWCRHCHRGDNNCHHQYCDHRWITVFTIFTAIHAFNLATVEAFIAFSQCAGVRVVALLLRWILRVDVASVALTILNERKTFNFLNSLLLRVLPWYWFALTILNERKKLFKFITLVCIYYLGTSNRRTDQCQGEDEQHHCRERLSVTWISEIKM